MSVPVFAVVGRVNKGKSSVIATLAEDERVAISRLPGTTRSVTQYPVKVDDTPQFVLVDTPGFEDAAAVLAWLQQTEPTADQRVARVAEFVEHFANTDEFYEERELLKPVLAGANILYVVDGTRPYRDNYQSEMEILQWTGRPSMALINRIGAGDHTAAWRNALGQFFKVVRDFDAHTASFQERIRLLRTFQELDPSVEAGLQKAISALRQERQQRVDEVVRIVTDLLVDSLTFTLETRRGDERQRREVEDEFHGQLRALEAEARGKVERLYHHANVSWQATELMKPVFGEDLFAAKVWQLLGLSSSQLIALYVVGGAVAGGVLDASVGGASFGTGAIVGTLAGAGAGLWHLTRRFEQAAQVGHLVDRASEAWGDGPRWRVGPFKHPNFPFILLDRARLHYDAIRTRAHAKNAVEEELGQSPQERTSGLSSSARSGLHDLFTKVRKRTSDVPPSLRQELEARVRAYLVDQDEDDS